MDEEIIKSDNSSTHLTTLPQPIRPIDQKSQEKNIKIEIKIYATEKKMFKWSKKAFKKKKQYSYKKNHIYKSRTKHLYQAES